MLLLRGTQAVEQETVAWSENGAVARIEGGNENEREAVRRGVHSMAERRVYWDLRQAAPTFDDSGANEG